VWKFGKGDGQIAMFSDLIDSRLQPEVDRDIKYGYCYLIVDIGEWKSDIRQDFQNTWYIDWANPWEWRYIDDKKWQPSWETIDGPQSSLEHVLGSFRSKLAATQVQIRVHTRELLQRLYVGLHDAILALREIEDAYRPPLDADSVVELIKNGPNEEHRRIRTAKYIVGVKASGVGQELD
jgi:hypothetical protein